jgi:hypothetical protein
MNVPEFKASSSVCVLLSPPTTIKIQSLKIWTGGLASIKSIEIPNPDFHNYLLPMDQIVSQYEIPGTKCEQKTGELSTINGTDCEPIRNPRDRNESRKLGNYLLPMEQIVS